MATLLVNCVRGFVDFIDFGNVEFQSFGHALSSQYKTVMVGDAGGIAPKLTLLVSLVFRVFPKIRGWFWFSHKNMLKI